MTHKGPEEILTGSLSLHMQLLKQIVARRDAQAGMRSESFSPDTSIRKASMPLEEVVEIVHFPEFDKKAVRRQREKIQNAVLSQDVVNQLEEYISHIADMYNDNPFHNVSQAVTGRLESLCVVHS